MARRRVKKTGQKSLGLQGRIVRNQILKQHANEIRKMKVELGKIKDPLQKELLEKQIKREILALRRFQKETA